ncbi:hypothetical protein BN2364_3585 [Alloalcanivorax xenomutans]|nr:hypothetical protein BN2364_3585 [Alloalcanivorax xenomutans]
MNLGLRAAPNGESGTAPATVIEYTAIRDRSGAGRHHCA